ncbi:MULTISPECIES: phage tail tape measure protein [unclassified Pseudomonas]|uniref:phage tail tape measure protein n=1 Tax=unclassified Pseudomonas TaxID=196821 RepID=UPI00131DB460|nr:MULTISPECIES: phage tail tape measure protein [unclassified Pseudomonas]
MEQQLAAHRKANRIPTDDYAEYLGKLNAMRDGLTKATDANEKYTMSAKAQAAALRGVPAQFTDIVVSLQGGQAPLTVLLQQGGQLKDMFGGIGPAAKALGGYVAGIINPFTAAAAAAGVLALAYHQGSQEQDAFRQALITTGNAAGLTTSQMAGMAKSVASTVGTTGQAADALAKLAATGKIPADQFEQIARAAVTMNKATGKAIEDTVAEFAAIAEDPTKAIAKLNESYNFLTASTYQQIKALQDEGDMTGAQALAWDTLSQATESRGKELVENLGYIESAWKSVAERAKEAWDAALDIGREDTLIQKLSKLQERLSLVANAKNAPLMLGDDPNPMDFSDDGQADAAEWKNVLQKEVDDTKAAREQMFGAQNFKAAQGDFDWLKGQMDSTKSKGDKLADVLGKIDKRVASARAQGFIISDADLEKLKDQEREKYKEKTPKTPKTKAYRDDEATRLLMAAKQQQAALEAQLNVTKKMGPAQRQLAEFEQQIADLKEKKTLTADQKSLVASQEQIKAQLQKNAAIEIEVERKKELQKLIERAAQLDISIASSLASLAEQYDRQLDGAGMGDQYRERLNQQKSIYREFQRYQEQLDKATPKDLLGSDQYNEAAAKIRTGQEKALKQSRDYYAELDRQNGDWTNGASDAWANYLLNARNVAGQAKSAFTSLYDGMTDAAVEWASGSKASFADVAVSFSKMIAKMALQAAASNVWTSLFGSVATSTASAGAASASSGFDYGLGSASQGLTYNAKGGVYDSPSLSAYSNQVHSTPKLFAFAKGAGVFGEAGPEAIMPLTRAADGSLGVRALNGGSSGQLPTASAPVSVEINIDSNGGAQVSSDTAGLQQFGQEMGRIAEAKYREMETRSLSSQGNIRQAINGRR